MSSQETKPVATLELAHQLYRLAHKKDLTLLKKVMYMEALIRRNQERYLVEAISTVRSQ